MTPTPKSNRQLAADAGREDARHGLFRVPVESLIIPWVEAYREERAAMGLADDSHERFAALR